MAKKKNYKCKLPPFKRKDFLSIQDVTQNIGWNISAYDLPKAWQYSEGEGVTIAVLDTGCDLTHSDLVENLLPGKNFCNQKKDPIDDNGHGTHVCGTLVASNNDIGMVGVAPKAKVRPIKCLDAEGNGNLLHVADAIRWAVEMGVDFISMSLGSRVPVQQVRKAIQAAAAKGIITFVAAGNAGNTKEIFYPAAYPEAISVGAVDVEMRRAKFSNTGNRLDFMAPGVDILSTVPESWYAKLSGTSMAQPFVCGVAALVKSYKLKKKPELKLDTADDYRELFKQYTTPVKNGNYDNPKFYQGFGIIDPRKFLESIKPH